MLLSEGTYLLASLIAIQVTISIVPILWPAVIGVTGMIIVAQFTLKEIKKIQNEAEYETKKKKKPRMVSAVTDYICF